MTIRRRLIIGVLAILAVLIAAVGTAEILVLRHVLYQRSAQGLRAELNVLATTPPLPASTTGGSTGSTTSSSTHTCASVGTVLPSGPPNRDGPTAGPGASHGRAPGPGGAAAVTQALADKTIASAIAGPDGTLLACAAAGRNGRQSSFSVPTSVLTNLPSGSGYVTVRSQGHHLLAISQPVGADTAILVTDLGSDDAAVRVVLTVTVLGGLAALLGAIALSLPLLRSALAPLRTVARIADGIAGGDLDQRTNLQRSRDEIGQLGTAFDRMVDRLQGALVERDTLVEQLRDREAAMRRFVADASHELRTPLTAIRGGAQVLRSAPSPTPTTWPNPSVTSKPKPSACPASSTTSYCYPDKKPANPASPTDHRPPPPRRRPTRTMASRSGRPPDPSRDRTNPRARRRRRTVPGHHQPGRKRRKVQPSSRPDHQPGHDPRHPS